MLLLQHLCLGLCFSRWNLQFQLERMPQCVSPGFAEDLHCVANAAQHGTFLRLPSQSMMTHTDVICVHHTSKNTLQFALKTLKTENKFPCEVDLPP